LRGLAVDARNGHDNYKNAHNTPIGKMPICGPAVEPTEILPHHKSFHAISPRQPNSLHVREVSTQLPGC
jgi:hypothetical protein